MEYVIRHVVIVPVTTMTAIVTVHLDVQPTGTAMASVTRYVTMLTVTTMEAIVRGIAHLDVNLGGQGMASVTRYVTMLTATTMEEIVHHSFRRNKERVKQAFNK